MHAFVRNLPFVAGKFFSRLLGRKMMYMGYKRSKIKDCQMFNVKKVSVLSFQGKEKKDCWEEEAKRRLLQEVLLGSQEEQVGRSLKKELPICLKGIFARARSLCVSPSCCEVPQICSRNKGKLSHCDAQMHLTFLPSLSIAAASCDNAIGRQILLFWEMRSSMGHIKSPCPSRGVNCNCNHEGKKMPQITFPHC